MVIGWEGDVPCDIEMGRLVEESNKSVKQLMLKTLGYTSTVWDVSELNCRTRECNVGSWMADLMRECDFHYNPPKLIQLS